MRGGGSSVDDIWIINADGTGRKRITYDNRGGAFPCFSPDDKKVIYMPYGPHNNREVWIMDADGTNKTRLIDDTWYPDYASFTPDGRILFTCAKVSPHSNKVDAGNIWMMNADGSNKMLVVPDAFPSNYTLGDFSDSPSMSPDKKMIIFDHGTWRQGFYYVTDPTGEWKDSDGDGVWDGIDGAPNDADRGYITDPFFLGTPVFVPLLVVICVVAAFERLKKRA